MGDLQLEIVLQKRGIPEIPEEFKELIEKYKTFESNDRISLNVPADWMGFKDGTVTQMFRAFGESIYVALAYFTKDDDEVVTDFEGKPVDRYDDVHNGVAMWKYVKKRLRIIKTLDKNRGVFEIKGYMTNFKYSNPVVNVLSIYSVGGESGFTAEDFLRRVDLNREG
jgi:hypothetical protein